MAISNRTPSRPAPVALATLLALLAGACHGSGAAHDAAAPVASTDHLPESFVDDTRRAVVLAARPAIDALFRANADASHYVGQVWGAVVDAELG